MTDNDPALDQQRSDIVCETDPKLASAIAKAAGQDANFESPAAQKKRETRIRRDPRFSFRRALVERRDDPFGFERIIGKSDLTSINYLSKGLKAAAAVCRIRIPGSGGESHGTGFLVGPRLLLTNHHVLASQDEASQAEAEFDYEHDADGVLKPPVQFNLKPAELFFTSMELDFTLVAVAPQSDRSISIERFGFIPLLPVSGKSLDGEWVSIIQHPGGKPKQISIRANRVIELKPGQAPGADPAKFIHYRTDTEPGSSGSPVLNDQWQAIALHHRAVAKPGTQNLPEPEWIANEGVRVSAIYAELERSRFTDPQASRALAALQRGLGLVPFAEPGLREALDFEKDRKPFKPARWQGAGLGYQDGFLAKPLPLGPMFAPLEAEGLVAPRNDGGGAVLDYRHYSSVIHKKRKFAIITAVNIDGGQLINPESRSNAWRRDPRIDDEYQPAGNFYEQAITPEKVFFSRGHLVRRLDPCWGGSKNDAVEAELDTFHYTNAAPQVQKYNDQDWGNLEDYVLNRAQISECKLSVFTGPVFRDDDPPYGKEREGGPWKIPRSFWKIAALERASGKVSAAAFLVGQVQYVQQLYEAQVFTSLSPYSLDKLMQIQTTVSEIARLTGLDLSAFNELDSLNSIEAARQVRWIAGPADIVI